MIWGYPYFRKRPILPHLRWQSPTKRKKPVKLKQIKAAQGNLTPSHRQCRLHWPCFSYHNVQSNFCRFVCCLFTFSAETTLCGRVPFSEKHFQFFTWRFGCRPPITDAIARSPTARPSHPGILLAIIRKSPEVFSLLPRCSMVLEYLPT